MKISFRNILLFLLVLSVFVLTTASGAPPEEKTICCKDGVPVGFIRVGSKSGANSQCPPVNQFVNLCVFVRYDNLKSGEKLRVCASSPTPPGFTEGEAFTDLFGCDSQSNSGSAHNEKWIQKQ
jgi:hypothetical protein